MNGESGNAAAARPWHVILAPTVPVLAFVSAHYGVLMPRMVWLLAAAAATATLCWVVLARVVGNSRTSALAVSILSLTALSQSTIAQLAGAIQLPQILPLSSVVAILLCVLVLRFGGTAAGLTMFANALMVSSLLLVISPIVVNHWQRWRSPTTLPPHFGLAAHPPSQTTPDVYVLILDGYGRADVLRDIYGVDSQLIGDLQSLGFQVAARATSNYAQTAQSVASMLNAEYLPALLGDGIPPRTARYSLRDLILDNRMFAAFAAAGYRIRAYPSEYGFIGFQHVTERPRPWLYLTDFEYGFYGTTVLPLLSTIAGWAPASGPLALHRHHVRWTLDHLQREIPQAGDPPTLVFAHLLIPHPPFSFEADGSPLASRLPANLNDGSHWRAQAAHSGERYEAGYVKGIQFLDSRIVEIVRRVLAGSGERPTIMYLLSDHGPSVGLDWEDPDRTDFRERLGILLAARFPEGYPVTLHPGTTPVNAFRILLNTVVGSELSPLEDRAYFSPWREPLRFIDVTDRVR